MTIFTLESTRPTPWTTIFTPESTRPTPWMPISTSGTAFSSPKTYGFVQRKGSSGKNSEIFLADS